MQMSQVHRRLNRRNRMQPPKETIDQRLNNHLGLQDYLLVAHISPCI
jgi:hypothetical protein